MFYYFFCKISLIFIILLSVNNALALSWQDFYAPNNQKPNAVGTYNNGCLLGGAVLPEKGEGFQVIRTYRNRFYGHPNLIDFIKSLAIKTKAQGLDDLLIADIALSLKQRETVNKLDVVIKKQFKVKLLSGIQIILL